MFLYNTWYVAAYATEVGDNLLGRRILDLPVVIYRQDDGMVSAIGDRCPHRFAPLHLGTRAGDRVTCAYHGLVFDSSGRCVHNPHGNGKIPPTAVVPRYPVAERHGLIWIWMGDPSLAKVEDIVALEHLDDPERRTIGGYLHVEANYQIMSDNLLDLSHTQFLHVDFQKTDWFNGRHEVRETGDWVVASAWIANSPASPLQAKNSQDPAAMVDSWFEVKWHLPAVVTLHSGHVPAGTPRPSIDPTIGTHLLTPETATTTHYFFGSSRNFLRDSSEVDERIREWQRIGFDEQDRPMLEAVGSMMNGVTDIFDLHPVLLASDAAAIKARRALSAAIDREFTRRTPKT